MSDNISHFVKSLEITGLWGDTDRTIDFHRDVNILIGPNGSGKTTILNMLMSALSGDVLALASVPFTSLKITLQHFETARIKTLLVTPLPSGGISFKVSSRTYKVHLLSRDPTGPVKLYPRHRRTLLELRAKLSEIAAAAWLPVTRRLPIENDDEEELAYSRQRRWHQNLESVDACLQQLVSQIAKYRLSLESELSRYYKEFERSVLTTFLYNKAHDRFSLQHTLTISGASDKNQLIAAFGAADLMNDSIRKHIDEHFTQADRVMRQLQTEGVPNISPDEFFIIPLISRTRSLVELARKLEEQRTALFSPLAQFTQVASDFFADKNVAVTDEGDISILKHEKPLSDLSHLSSGEKQILILLIQALLSRSSRVVFAADEPELSLHVRWQEKLLRSIVALMGEAQLIVATHSPDIVGLYTDKVIDLEKSAK